MNYERKFHWTMDVEGAQVEVQITMDPTLPMSTHLCDNVSEGLDVIADEFDSIAHAFRGKDHSDDE